MFREIKDKILQSQYSDSNEHFRDRKRPSFDHKSGGYEVLIEDLSVFSINLSQITETQSKYI